MSAPDYILIHHLGSLSLDRIGGYTLDAVPVQDQVYDHDRQDCQEEEHIHLIHVKLGIVCRSLLSGQETVQHTPGNVI